MSNTPTALGQSRAPRSQIDNEEVPVAQADWERVGLLSARPALSRSSSNGSASSGRGVLRRIFIDRSTTPSHHLSRPTFPPPSASSYSPLPPTELSIAAKINLFINQTISIVVSTFFLAIVTSWAVGNELIRALPKWIRGNKGKKFIWDDEKYWRKEGKKISKEPRDYARQVGMDIVDQRVETEDGYYLK
jgi:lysosomal acid lipase/cholesteryl ester hydrolase